MLHVLLLSCKWSCLWLASNIHLYIPTVQLEAELARSEQYLDDIVAAVKEQVPLVRVMQSGDPPPRLIVCCTCRCADMPTPQRRSPVLCRWSTKNWRGDQTSFSCTCALSALDTAYVELFTGMLFREIAKMLAGSAKFSWF